MKKLLILGEDHFTIPVVEAAKKQGYYVIRIKFIRNLSRECHLSSSR